MTKEEAKQILIEYCKSKGSMNQEKWVGLVQAAYQKGHTRGYCVGAALMMLAATIVVAIITFPF